MINLPVDEGYAFDYLSILALKWAYDPTNKDKLNIFTLVTTQIHNQLGDLFLLIRESDEYKELASANRETFELVDLAKEDKVKASDVDKANYKRYLKKIALQKKFFSTEITESKIGYEKYD